MKKLFLALLTFLILTGASYSETLIWDSSLDIDYIVYFTDATPTCDKKVTIIITMGDTFTLNPNINYAFTVIAHNPVNEIDDSLIILDVQK